MTQAADSASDGIGTGADLSILIAGAGATGGAFGTYLQEAGRDVTFLLRQARAETVRAEGLRFTALGDDRTNQVDVITAEELTAAPRTFDLVIVAVKAGGLDSVIADIGPAVGEQTTIIPFLNGMAQIEKLQSRYPGQVLGGFVKIVGTIRDGAVVQLTDLAVMTIGDLHGAEVPTRISEALDVPGFKLQTVDGIIDGLWEKWIFIAAAGVVTCLFRAPVGAIMEAGGRSHVYAIIDELEAVAAAAGHPVSEASHAMTIKMLTEDGSAFTSSLYRDVMAGLPSETEHILGDLSIKAEDLEVATPLLDLTLVQLRAGEAQKRL
ncbi:ketopantoate reductase family protein [Brevibacterium sp. JSBI002]|uniref:ketopantoate reductase family protein n=1 Tax=Brevibacterium sp. JSBI002 TaxID=2886045 RepID=UPI00223019D7|nr:2-dehydropantoate 2-reductase [Brevibacterium sp. JSBI002]UZD63478.1 2-dehydropantoate 2-reductase [Brevibacterium sp. JSBI002]